MRKIYFHLFLAIVSIYNAQQYCATDIYAGQVVCETP
jgi:hypothetical protein